MRLCVALILEKDGKFLVEKRKSTKELHPGDIVFPSGKVNPGEDPKATIIREMKEELGIVIVNPSQIYEDEFEYKGKQKVLWFKCEKYEGNIKANEAEELIWIDPSQDKLLSYENSRNALKAYLRIR